jgi:hypothetical protein
MLTLPTRVANFSMSIATRMTMLATMPQYGGLRKRPILRHLRIVSSGNNEGTALGQTPNRVDVGQNIAIRSS